MQAKAGAQALTAPTMERVTVALEASSSARNATVPVRRCMGIAASQGPPGTTADQEGGALRCAALGHARLLCAGGRTEARQAATVPQVAFGACTQAPMRRALVLHALLLRPPLCLAQKEQSRAAWKGPNQHPASTHRQKHPPWRAGWGRGRSRRERRHCAKSQGAGSCC